MKEFSRNDWGGKGGEWVRKYYTWMLCCYWLQQDVRKQFDFFKFCRLKHGESAQNKTNCSYSQATEPQDVQFPNRCVQEWIYKKTGDEKIWGIELRRYRMPGAGGFAFKASEKSIRSGWSCLCCISSFTAENFQDSSYFSYTSTTQYMLMRWNVLHKCVQFSQRQCCPHRFLHALTG